MADKRDSYWADYWVDAWDHKTVAMKVLMLGDGLVVSRVERKVQKWDIRRGKW